jgi:hypothetical protein
LHAARAIESAPVERQEPVPFAQRDRVTTGQTPEASHCFMVRQQSRRCGEPVLHFRPYRDGVAKLFGRKHALHARNRILAVCAK